LKKYLWINLNFFSFEKSVLRIRDVYPGSEFFPSRIPDPNFSITDSHQKNLSILTPKKWFLSSRKYDPGFSSRIPDPDPYFLPIPDPGSSDQKGTGSRSETLGKKSF
jgi:hypothetical protein